MKKSTKKLLGTILATSLAICGTFGFSACGEDKVDEHAWGSEYSVQSAYAVAQDLGYTGSLEDFIATISGKDGADGKDGINGKDGADGKDGTNGKDGIDGVGVKTAYIDNDGNLIIELTNNTTVNCGNISVNSEMLQYRAIKEDGEITGYIVAGAGTVSDADIVIPDIFKGKPVTEIASRAFYVNSGNGGISYLTSVVIGNNITSIGVHAFGNCSTLTSITIPDSVVFIDNNAFYHCSGLTDITFNGTQEQWNAIEKGGSWNNFTGEYTVHCTDGDIAKE